MSKDTLESALSVADTFIQIFGVIVALGIVGEVGFGIRHWLLNKQLQRIERSDEQARAQEIANLNKAAGEANEKAGKANERAAKAEEHLADANRRAAEADQKAESFRLDIAKANERASNNEKEAALLRKAAEDERLARVKLEESIAWRAPSQELIGQLAPSLQKFAGQRYSIIFDRDQRERLFLFMWLSTLLDESKWKFETFGAGMELKLPATNIIV